MIPSSSPQLHSAALSRPGVIATGNDLEQIALAEINGYSPFPKTLNRCPSEPSLRDGPAVIMELKAKSLRVSNRGRGGSN